MELDPHQILNIKEKDKQVQLNSNKKNRWQAELATRSQKGGNCNPNYIYLKLTSQLAFFKNV